MVNANDNDGDEEHTDEATKYTSRGTYDALLAPFRWLAMLARETHWSFVFGVLSVYGVSQGVGKGFYNVATEYYMKDILKVQPSESQVYQGIIGFSWYVKPLWGLLTDVVPIMGYRRRPYFIIAGVIGVVSMLVLSMHKNVGIVFAIVLLAGESASVAIADVTIDACVAQNSYILHSLAADFQSLCSLSSAVGSLIGFSLSGILIHLIGPKGVYSLLCIPAGLVVLVGMVLNEPEKPGVSYKHVKEKFASAGKAMWSTLKIPVVWRPCLYMLLSISISLGVNEGMFYWITDAKDGPHFSEESVGFIFSIGSVGSLLGALLYLNVLKDYLFRDLLLYSQILFGLSGLLDLVLVLRLNLRMGVPDYVFVVIDACVSQMIGRVKWMPLLVLSAKLCPPGIEGTFFALLMSIDNVGLFTSSWGGGLMLKALNVTRTSFDNLWLAIVIRTVLRISPITLLFLIPGGDHTTNLLDDDVLKNQEFCKDEDEDVELVALVDAHSK